MGCRSFRDCNKGVMYVNLWMGAVGTGGGAGGRLVVAADDGGGGGRRREDVAGPRWKGRKRSGISP